MLAVKLTDALDMLFLAQFSSSLLFQILPSYGRLNREPQRCPRSNCCKL